MLNGLEAHGVPAATAHRVRAQHCFDLARLAKVEPVERFVEQEKRLRRDEAERDGHAVVAVRYGDGEEEDFVAGHAAGRDGLDGRGDGCRRWTAGAGGGDDGVGFKAVAAVRGVEAVHRHGYGAVGGGAGGEDKLEIGVRCGLGME